MHACAGGHYRRAELYTFTNNFSCLVHVCSPVAGQQAQPLLRHAATLCDFSSAVSTGDTSGVTSVGATPAIDSCGGLSVPFDRASSSFRDAGVDAPDTCILRNRSAAKSGDRGAILGVRSSAQSLTRTPRRSKLSSSDSGSLTISEPSRRMRAIRCSSDGPDGERCEEGPACGSCPSETEVAVEATVDPDPLRVGAVGTTSSRSSLRSRFPFRRSMRFMIQTRASEQPVNIPSTRINSCPGMWRSDSSVPWGYVSPSCGRSGI